MIFKCPLCDKEFSSKGSGVVECPSCKGKVRACAGGGTAIDVEGKGRWADAFMSVVKKSIVDPVGHFEMVSRGTGWVRPWIFALVISTIVFLIAAAYQMGFQMLAAGAEFAAEIADPFTIISLPFSAAFLITFAIVGVPLGTTIGLFVQAGIYHLCLMLLGCAKRSFIDTFRVTCYAIGPQLFQIIPLLGGMVAWVWQIVLTVIGIKVVHKTSYGKSSMAVLLPLLLCCGMFLLIGIAVAGWIFAAALATSS